MFCTTCATLNNGSAERCRGCGGRLSFPPVAPVGRQARPARRRRVVGAMPLLIVVAVLALLGGRLIQDRQTLAAAYERAAAAFAAGDYQQAQEGFVAAGDYGDARARAAAIEQLLAPYRSKIDSAAAALESGDHDEAIALLRGVVETLPGDDRVSELLERARSERLRALEIEAANAERAEDWLGAELALIEILNEDPDNAGAAARLASLRATRSPFVFSREGTIYIDSPDLSSEKPIVQGLSAAWPVWSPDRKRIAFVNYPPDRRGIDGDLYVVNSDGAGLRMVTSEMIPFTWPVWSPDGTRIAFTSSAWFDPRTGAGHIPIYMVEVETGKVTDLTGPAFSYAAAPTWSPDSTRIAFVDRTIRPTGSSYFEISPGDVRVVDVETLAIRNLTGTRIEHEWWVSWAPAGERIAVMTNPGDWTSEVSSAIHLVNATSGVIETIPSEVWRIGYPYWSPEGSRIAFVEGDDVIRIWSEAGTEWIRLSSDISLQISWAPGGHALIAPAATSVEPSYLVPITERFGERTMVRLRFDTGGGPNGPPVWGPRTARGGEPSGSGTALDRAR